MNRVHHRAHQHITITQLLRDRDVRRLLAITVATIVLASVAIPLLMP